MNTIHLDRNNALIESYAKIESLKHSPKYDDCYKIQWTL